jgi:hypothetical protein
MYKSTLSFNLYSIAHVSEAFIIIFTFNNFNIFLIYTTLINFFLPLIIISPTLLPFFSFFNSQ